MKRPSTRIWSVHLFHMQNIGRNVLPTCMYGDTMLLGTHPDHRAPTWRLETNRNMCH